MIKHYSILNDEVLEEIDFLISDKRYEHFYLINAIQKIKNKTLEYCDAWSIKGGKDSWILGVWTRDTYYLFGNNWITSQLTEVNKLIEFEKFKSFAFSGTHNLLEDIQNLNFTVNFHDNKLRNFFRIDGESKITSEHVNIRYAKLDDLQVLISMRIDYYFEEYNGENNKSEFEIAPIVRKGIYNNRLFVIQNAQGNLIGSCSVLDSERLGIIFIKKGFRKKGYGKSLLACVTKKLLEKNSSKKCYLMTDKLKGSSNKLAFAVGYKRIYQYSTKILNNCG